MKEQNFHGKRRKEEQKVRGEGSKNPFRSSALRRN
jgi:hypothetical protein